jgi:hypothetical protein
MHGSSSRIRLAAWVLIVLTALALVLPATVLAQEPPVTDVAMDAIVKGPTRTAAGDKALVAAVTNVGTSTVEVCDIDISWDIDVNGIPTTGSVNEPAACNTLGPGASAKFKATWTYGAGEPGAGALVSYTATVIVASDFNTTNNSDTELRTAK